MNMGNENNIKLKSMLRKGTMLHGTYRIDGYLSSGGFGNTYVATHINFEKQYAIKEFFMDGVNERVGDSATVKVSNDSKVEEFKGQRAKFYKEAQRLHELSNRHIVRVHDLFDENGTTYYVMDYIDGESLKERLRRTGQPMSEQEVEDVLRQVLDALGEVHSQGLYHMDLKPANIMMDSKGVVKLIDFGASKQFNTEKGGALSTSAVTYTNGYAPREQMERNYQKFGPWTDFYALGATLYNLLSNRTPPMPTDIDDDRTPDKHLALPKPANVSTRMWNLVLWMLKTHRQDRPQSVDDITTHLNQGINEPNPATDAPQNAVEKTKVAEDKTKPVDDKPKPVEVQPKPIDSKKPKPAVNQPKSTPKNTERFLKKLAIAACAGIVLLGAGFALMRVIKNAQRDHILQKLEDNMVWVEGGTFTMGATPEQGNDARDYEKPAHQVTLSGFYICKYEVTQELWQAVMGTTIRQQLDKARYSSPNGEGANYPMYCISWEECQTFIYKLNSLTGKHYRMPSEAEWEYAARGGNRSKGYKYAGSNDTDSVAWYDDNLDGTTHPVGTKSPNELGLYDMSGNVWEWCADWYGSYSSGSQTNPTGASSGSVRVIRGGICLSDVGGCRVSRRSDYDPMSANWGLGLRLALSSDE